MAKRRYSSGGGADSLEAGLGPRTGNAIDDAGQSSPFRPACVGQGSFKETCPSYKEVEKGIGKIKKRSDDG